MLRRGEHPGGRPGDLEHDVGAGSLALLEHASRHVVRAGSSASSPSSARERAPRASGSTTSTARPRARATSAIRSPIGPPPMTTAVSPARDLAAPDVVAGDRQRLRERAEA